MHAANPETPPGPPGLAPAPRGSAPLASLAAGALLFGALLTYSLVQSPIPGVNEPQYLGKALHLADPTYCPGDFFLDSSDPHGVFGLLFGPAAERYGLETAAFIARVAGLTVLACGWTLLARRVIGTAWAAPLSGAAFLAAAAAGNLSGEWLVGGAEGKVFAYGFVFAAYALASPALRTSVFRLPIAAALAGAAASFHPIVGVWGVGCGLCAAALLAWRRRRRGEPAGRPSAGAAALAALLFLAAAAPGLYFALNALEAPPGTDVGRANFLQVYLRLPHHLDPMTFRTPGWVGFAHLTLAWVLLRRRSSRTAAEPAFALTVLGSLVVAYVGVLIGLRVGEPHEAALPYLRAFLLKFYPFRLADVLIPLAASFALAGAAIRWAGGRSGRGVGVWTGAAALLGLALWIPFYDRDPAGLAEEEAVAWREMCEWIDDNLPPDAVVVTPTHNHGFKWFAQRAEYVAFKDCPQDAPGILEWNRRLKTLQDWAQTRYADDRRLGYDRGDLDELAALTGATHLLAGELGPISASPHQASGPWWRLYELRNPDEN